MNELTPGMTPVEFTDGRGRRHRVYAAPYPTEGPVQVAFGGRPAWVFMYAHFVFTWARGEQRMRVEHGSIHGSRMLLWPGVPISGTWSAETLAEVGQRWTRAHLAKFRKG
ncbi:hypothetical protein [Amycolatopsis nigrescens]|uniref:hypothetical protein n=1 Tax=Amycolatopsis nigrescens TaxID=381445 RepID=UPI0007C53515|nr:hypothetical protein [Amycolatopsis nigrescens]